MTVRKKIVGLWINTGTHMGQVFWGKHSYRTSDSLKHFQHWEREHLREHCFLKGWDWSYLWA